MRAVVAGRLVLAVDDQHAAYPITIKSVINGTADARIESNQADAQLGYSVAGAGDVNGDGFADVIVGAQQYDLGQLNEGAAFIYFGSAGAFNVTADAQLESNQEGAQLGTSVAGGGDVNGDGFADVLVGAPLPHGGTRARPSVLWERAGDQYHAMHGSVEPGICVAGRKRGWSGRCQR